MEEQTPRLDAREARNELLRHLDGLYALAQAVTLDEPRAARLVEATFRRAYGEIEEGATRQDMKMWLTQILLAEHRQEPGEVLAGPEGETGESPADPLEATSSVRRRMAGQVLNRTLPLAVATLPAGLRTVLVLHYVDGEPDERAADMLGVAEDTFSAMLHTAEDQLVGILRGMYSEAEWDFLTTWLPDDWMDIHLGPVVRDSFPAAPPALRMAVEREWEPSPSPSSTEVRLPVRMRGRYGTGARRNTAARGILIAGLLILGTGVVGLLLSRLVRQDETETSLVALMAHEAGETTASLHTDSQEQAEGFVLERLGFRLTLPDIAQAELTGVGIHQVASGVEVPVFLYDDAAGAGTLVLYAYNYAVLDRLKDSITLESDVLSQIADDEHFDLHDLGAEKVLIWRSRDDIFMAVTQGDAEMLRERIFPAS